MFGAGCFWGVEETFRNLDGVTNTAVGYAGGSKDNPTYEDVCTDDTGHAEVVEVEFDPDRVSYEKVLDVFWSNHNPTQLNRQGPDSGPSYRSEIFFATPEQEKVARAYIDQLGKAHVYQAAIVTKVEKLRGFYKAEGYHQDYLIHHPTQPYIVHNDLPKIENFKKMYPSLYRDTPVMITAIN